MASIYSLIESNLSELRLHTELLEACGWDETVLEEFSSHLQLALHHITDVGANFEEGKILLKEILELNEWSDLHYSIVISIMELRATDIKQFMIGGDK